VRSGGTMAASDRFRIVVRGRQTHAAAPWGGVDPIVTSAQIVTALQTIASRQIDVRAAPVIVTVGMINGGVRNNIIPDSVVLVGTIRTMDADAQREVHERVRRTAEMVAASAGATADVDIAFGYPVTYNDPSLTEWAMSTLHRVAGDGGVRPAPAVLGAEDFSYFAREVPGVYFFLGIVPEGQDPAAAPQNHSPYFYADEGALPLGVRALAGLAVDFLTSRRVASDSDSNTEDR
jgi:amidohydrolase